MTHNTENELEIAQKTCPPPKINTLKRENAIRYVYIVLMGGYVTLIQCFSTCLSTDTIAQFKEMKTFISSNFCESAVFHRGFSSDICNRRRLKVWYPLSRLTVKFRTKFNGKFSSLPKHP
jgi:hypothetical protein